MWALRLTCSSLAAPRASAARQYLQQQARAPVAMASTAAGGSGGGGVAAGGTVAAEQQQQPQAQGKVRSYPDEPRVGVGVVILRQLSPQQPEEVLLIRRAKEPSKGLWCFPGGSLELGETLVECAVREVGEETGLRLNNAPQEGALFSDALAWPSPVSASDGIVRDEGGRLLYHYAIINLAATLQDPGQTPVPADDVDGAQWFPVGQLRGLKDLVVNCAQVAERAVQQYTVQP